MDGIASFFNMFDWSMLLDWVLRGISALICIIIHEVCHGLAALGLGDPTAKSQHRLSLNPLRHIDPVGLLMMIVVGFGWAKPVPVDMRYFKKPKLGMALTALAGPASNVLLAFALFWGAGMLLSLTLTETLVAIINFLLQTAILSVGLCVFNLIPFPPLDGSKIVAAFLPDKIYYKYMQYERYGMIVLLLVFWVGGGSEILSQVIVGVAKFICSIVGFPSVLLFG